MIVTRYLSLFVLIVSCIDVGNVCLAYIIIIRIFKQTTRIKIENASTIAFITALLWAVHPMNVESVAWVSASKILIYAFFYLAATYFYLIFLQRKNFGFYLLTCIFFLLSFFSKEQAFSFPFWMLMLYWILGKSFKDRNVWIHLAPFLLLAIAGGIVTMLSQAAVGVGVLSNEIAYPLWQRFILGCYSFFEYIVKFVIPNNLMYLYPFPMVVGEPLPKWMLFYPAITLIILATLWNHIKKIPFSAGLAFFLIHIAIVLHIIPLSRFAVIADRYIYVSGIGLSFIAAFYIVRFFASKKGTIRRTAIVCFIGITLFFSVYSNIRSHDWKDTDSIKKEMRKLLREREDYIHPEFENLMEDEKELGLLLYTSCELEGCVASVIQKNCIYEKKEGLKPIVLTYY